jgi:hypothetical protein
LEFWVKIHVNKKYSNSLMLTNSKGGIGAMYFQLDLEVIYKRSKKERTPSNFHEF